MPEWWSSMCFTKSTRRMRLTFDRTDNQEIYTIARTILFSLGHLWISFVFKSRCLRRRNVKIIKHQKDDPI